MIKKIKLNPKAAFNDENKKVGVVLPIAEFNQLIETIEELQDIQDVRRIKAQNPKYYPLEDIMAEIRKGKC